MRKLFTKIHLWLSLPFGIIITLTCFSGAMLVFEKEIDELLYPSRYYVRQTHEQALPLDLLMKKVAVTLPDTVQVSGVTLFDNPTRAYQVALSKPRRASLYLNQYTGEVTWRTERTPFFGTMFRLHRWLLDTVKPQGQITWGKMIVGVSTIVFVFILITGLVIWLPRTAKGIKNRLKINVTRGWKRLWYDLHIAGGFYSLLLLLVMALTGLTWSFQWYREGFYKVFGVEMAQPPGQGARSMTAQPQGERDLEGGKGRGNHAEGRPEGAEGRPEGRDNGGEGASEGRGNRGNRGESGRGSEVQKSLNFTQWQPVFDQLALANPTYSQIRVSDGSAAVSFSGWGNQRASDQYKFDAKSGEITETSLYKDQEASGKMRGWIYSVHVGSWGGMLVRVLTVIASLIGAVLPLTGYYMWWLRNRIQRNRRRK